MQDSKRPFSYIKPKDQATPLQNSVVTAVLQTTEKGP